MIGDRDYMRGGYGTGGFGGGFGPGGLKNFVLSSAINTIIAVCAIVLFVQLVSVAWFGVGSFEGIFALSPAGVKSGKIWTFITYAFLHEGLLHLVLNMLVLYFAGKYVEQACGKGKTWAIFIFCALCGGLLWLLSAWLRGENAYLVGASAGAVGMLAYFCLLYPDRPLTFLLFFVFPLRIKPKIMLLWIAGFEFFGMMLFEMAPQGGASIAYSAHLGGIIGAVLSAKFFGRMGSIPYAGAFKKMFGGGKKYRYAAKAEDTVFSVNISDRDALRKEVNRILDKMNTEGFSSLTDNEKELLNRAKDIL